MQCDIAALAAYIRAPSLSQPACAFAPAERSGEAWSAEQAFGSVLGLCPGNWGLSSQCPFPEPLQVFPRPCLVQAAGAPRRRARRGRGELCGETSPWGAGRLSFLRDLGFSSTPPRASP